MLVAGPVIDTVGSRFTTSVHENVAGVVLALSFNVTVNEAVPRVDAEPDSTVVAPLELLSDSQGGPLRVQL